MEQEDVFETIKKFYMSKLHFTESLVDYLSNEEVLLACVEGHSNFSISNKFFIEEPVIESIIKDYLGFSGWKHDLDFSPYDIYKASSKTMEEYIFNCYMISPNSSNNLVLTTYFICRIFDEIKERMDNEYYRT